MINAKKYYYGIGVLFSIIVLWGCSKDFLERPPLNAITDASFYKTDDQVLAGTASLYNVVWFDYNDKAQYGLGDFRAGIGYSPYNDRDNVLFNTTGLSDANSYAWRSFFVVVGQSNLAIQNINKYAGSAVTPQVKKIAIAEARFMRALAYRFLVMNWGDVPVIKNNLTILTDTTVTLNTVSSVWQFITDEMRAAANDLPETPIMEGRVTKWSAEAMLARFYLTRSGVVKGNRNDQEAPNDRNQVFLDSAKYFAERVITLSGKSLLGVIQDATDPYAKNPYARLFKFPYDNNSESLFELQWVYSGYPTGNSAPAFLAYSKDIQDGDGYGGDKSATWWMLSLYDGFVANATGDTLKGQTPDLRLQPTFMFPGFVYPEITRSLHNPEGKEKPMTFPLNTNQYGTYASIKKYVIGKAEDIIPFGGNSGPQNYPNDTYMMRLAEVYLIYAEAALGTNPGSSSTTDSKALGYFNMIHERAGLPTFTGPLTLDVILKERFKEFAMEGMAWYDLVSLHYYDPERAYSILNSQDRQLFFFAVDKFPNPTTWTISKVSVASARTINANSGNFLIPLPTVELGQAPNLRKTPVDYVSK